ncbi:hypothetical protein AB0903_01340 [Streptomyces sp. NPDC048389]|uniref:hypothetical protein n=1 Tax=Streptomyces sp. NPDC048389 TaxID=3154622 RepID=UPI0034556A82
MLLRPHAAFDHQGAWCGSVVAYGADNLGSAASELWAVQFTGTAETVRPTDEELERLGPCPRRIDDRDFRPAHLRIEPCFVTVHTMDGSPGGAAVVGAVGAIHSVI